MRMILRAIRGAWKPKYPHQNSIRASPQCVAPYFLWADWTQRSRLIAPVRRPWRTIWTQATGGIARTHGIHQTMSGNRHVPPSMCPALTPSSVFRTARLLQRIYSRSDLITTQCNYIEMPQTHAENAVPMLLLYSEAMCQARPPKRLLIAGQPFEYLTISKYLENDLK